MATKPEASPLLTDLYQLTMLQAYRAHGMAGTAVFELFARKLPARRGFLMAAGLAQALDYLETLRFAPEELDWLARSRHFDAGFIDYLAGLRFTGAVHAPAEGTVLFANEPIIRVTAPLPEAQLVETRLINLLHFETVIASKAARMVLAAPAKLLIDFGLRRAHGGEAGLLAARGAYIAGFAGTATLQAAPLFGIPVYGTMAHSFIQVHDDESAAFAAFARARPESPILLIDTYDTEKGARKVVTLACRLKAEGITISGVRLDSGDLIALAKSVRRILDEGGLPEVKIFASGGLDEDKLQQAMAEGAPIDGFGVGTSLTTSEDAPALDCAYKLQEYEGQARRKRSAGKVTWPGRKQVYRRYDREGRMAGDVLTVEGDRQDGEALIQPVMAAGKRIAPDPSLEAVRAHAAGQLAKLPPAFRALDPAASYPVEVAPALRDLATAVDRWLDSRPA